MSRQIFPPPFFDQFNRLAIRYQLRTQGSQITPEDAQILKNKRARLQKLIDMFSHQSDAFILNYASMDDSNPIISLDVTFFLSPYYTQIHRTAFFPFSPILSRLLYFYDLILLT